MKKNFKMVATAVVLSAMMMTGVAGCGKNPDADVNSIHNLADISKYVEVADYSDMTVGLFDNYTVDEETVEGTANYYFSASAQFASTDDLITDRAVQTGDTVCIDYVGYKEGVAFDGGTAEGASLKIGSGSYIPGFEDGLIDVMPGETVDLNLTFPEAYGSAELAGADVVFTVTVQGIYHDQDLYDAWKIVSGYSGEVKSYNDIKEYYRKYIEGKLKENYDADLEDGIIRELLARCTFKDEFPAPLILKYQDTAKDVITRYAAMQGMDVDTFAANYLGTSYNDYVQNSSYQQIQLDAAFQFIALKEGLTLTDEQLAARFLEYLADMGVADPAAQAATMDAEDYRMFFLEEDVMEFLRNKVTIIGQ